MIVKICGLTNLEDALTAANAGAGLLGFIFHPASPRSISPRDCSRIIARLQQSGFKGRSVGVFVNQPVERVWAVLEECGLDLAQLSGDEPVGDLQALDRRAYKALRAPSLADARRYAQGAAPPALLLDAHHPALYGGTGRTADWKLARLIAARFPILLAGGLNPANLAEAIAQVHPWGVDVASGVESSPGRKDHHKVLAFVRTAHLTPLETY
jgi:phosphoribosylanthranilate isomerase